MDQKGTIFLKKGGVITHNRVKIYILKFIKKLFFSVEYVISISSYQHEILYTLMSYKHCIWYLKA